MKRSILAMVLLACVLLSACGGLDAKPVLPVTQSYEALREEDRDANAAATILYDVHSREYAVSHILNEDAYSDTVLIVPRYVDSLISVVLIRSDVISTWAPIERTRMNVRVEENTLLRLSLSDYGEPNRMWYMEITLPDGTVFSSPIPYACEHDTQDPVHVEGPWNGEDLLPDDWGDEPTPTLKPVLYLYPQKECRVDVELDYAGELTCTYPKYEKGWSVTARPDGTLTDDRGQEYNYLYWEGVGYKNFDFSRGFCVPGEDTAAFLEEALEKLGLTRREANEFIVYWLPLMEGNPYNVIAFQTETYEEAAKLTVSPQPDTVIRVFMAWYGTEDPVELPAQHLTAPVREGFTLVEWGGSHAIAP